MSRWQAIHADTDRTVGPPCRTTTEVWEGRGDWPGLLRLGVRYHHRFAGRAPDQSVVLIAAVDAHGDIRGNPADDLFPWSPHREFPRDLAEQIRIAKPKLWNRYGKGGGETRFTGDTAYHLWEVWRQLVAETGSPEAALAAAEADPMLGVTGPEMVPGELYEWARPKGRRDRFMGRAGGQTAKGWVVAQIKWGGIGKAGIPAMLQAIDFRPNPAPQRVYVEVIQVTPGVRFRGVMRYGLAPGALQSFPDQPFFDAAHLDALMLNRDVDEAGRNRWRAVYDLEWRPGVQHRILEHLSPSRRTNPGGGRSRRDRCVHPTGMPLAEEESYRLLYASEQRPSWYEPRLVGVIHGVSHTGPVAVWTTRDVTAVWLYDATRGLALALGRLGHIDHFAGAPYMRLHSEPGLMSKDDEGCGLGVCLYMGAALVANLNRTRSGETPRGIFSAEAGRTRRAGRVWDSLWARGLAEEVEDEDGTVIDLLSAEAVRASGHLSSPPSRG